MNSPTPPEDQSPPPDPNVNAAAIAAARARVAARRAENEERDRIQARQDAWHYDNWADPAGILLSRAGISIVFTVIWMLAAGVIWLAQALRWPSYSLVWTLDFVTGARALRMAPFVVWAFWGAVFGGCLGYWLISPLYSDRETRGAILLYPFLAMLGVALTVWGFVR